ncbi:MAG: geranylgeranyl pyrophosphate synthase [Patescibacteria group bacterium]|nr:MAG: geranylgeranyl pyrophosphate synthase [Patescibacteria group bacterium]
MDLESNLIQHKDHISEVLAAYLKKKKQTFTMLKPYGDDVFNRLEIFLLKGKMIRGGLILSTLQLFKKNIAEDHIRIACVIELIHSALLIHDDIMDNDTLRRGEKTLHVSYAETFSGKHKLHVGKSLAICVGDVCFFLAFAILSQTSLPAKTKQHIQKLLCDEFIKVGLMQMQDVALSTQNHLPKDSDIIALYTYKTARYTFSLPFIIGALLAEARSKTIKDLQLLGEYMGIIFQIKDDELGIYATEEELGKPIGSDLRENKKTFHYVRLMSKASAEDKTYVLNLQRKKHITHNDMKTYQLLLEKYNVTEDVQNLIKSYRQKAIRRIKKLPISPLYQQSLSDFLDSTILRKK